VTPPFSDHVDLFRIATDMSPAGILAVGADGTILLANREIERLFGWRREDLVGRPVEVLLPMNLRRGHSSLRSTFFADPRARHMGAGRDLRGVRKDGTEFPVEVGLNPVATPNGVVTLASVLDVSTRMELERASRQTQKIEAIGTLAGGIAHDFNNILLAIVGHTELAQRSLGNSANPDLDQVLSAAERGRQLVQRILAFSRTRTTTRIPVDLAQSVREACNLIRSSLPATIEMNLQLAADTPHVLSDEIELHQVVMNLATNAAHAMPAGGLLTIETRAFTADDAWRSAHAGLPGPLLARIVVSDQGTGMPPEVAERAFEPFFTTKSVGQGTGLGLSVVHGIVRDHGGVIELESEPGRGTTFTITLPVTTAAAETAVPHPTRRQAQRIRVLMVEDEENLGRMQRRLLEGMGYSVTLHSGSLAALEDFRAHPDDFDLLVTDNTMPKLTGLQLVEELHKIRGDLPVVMVSGLAERSDGLDLGSMGIRVLLRKPHTSGELDEAIREALRHP
jgi:hypothetical protein